MKAKSISLGILAAVATIVVCTLDQRAEAQLGDTGNGGVSVGPVSVGIIPYPRFNVTGPPATVDVETQEIMRLMRSGVGGVKNQNSAGFFVGAFEPGIIGRSRLDINVAGLPSGPNVFGSVPDVTVMSLLGNGNVGIGVTSPGMALDVQGRSRVRDGIGGPAAGTAGLWFNTANRFGPGGIADIGFVGAVDATRIGFFGNDPRGGSGWGFTFDTVTGNVGIGTGTLFPGHKLQVNGDASVQALTITGADLAEAFTIDPKAAIQPGLVVAIDPKHPGQLRVADHAYDRLVAGIVAGANGNAPGVILASTSPAAEHVRPVALSGRVYVWADATKQPIHPGDLLTTAYTPGHAMKVTDHARAQGATIGKAMSALAAGRGLVLVLVSLQ